MAYSKLGSSLLVGAVIAILFAVVTPVFYPLQEFFNNKDAHTPAGNTTFNYPACSKISTILPSRAFAPGHPTYEKSRFTHFPLQASDYEPACIVKPHDASEVSSIVKVLRQEFDAELQQGTIKSQFSIRSGGHSYDVEFSIVDKGVTIDLHHVNEVQVSKDRQSVVIGTGATWGDVYSKLDNEGLSVAGGRAAAVGVGGLLLGGGISYLSPRVGFANGNILNYEVILADGSVTNASPTENPDLWRALQAGINNFGIVTRFTVRAWPQGKVWGGYVYYTNGKAHKLLDAFHDFVKPANFRANPDAAGPIMGFGYTKVLGFDISLIASNYIYTKPEKWPACFDKFKAVSSVWGPKGIRTMTDATKEITALNGLGYRRSQVVTTFKNDNATLHDAFDLFQESRKMVRGIKDIEWSVSYQPVPPSVPAKDSTDPFGLADLDDTLVIYLITCKWSDAKDDQLMNNSLRKLIGDVERLAESRGVAHPYRYANYAARGQRVYDAYGEKQKQFLQETSRVYDPEGFFQRACVGDFKLDLSYD